MSGVEGSSGAQEGATRLGSRVYYEVVSRCNLRCVHCSDLFHARSRELPRRDVLGFQACLAECGTRDSVVTGGEPTLHSEFEELVAGLSEFGAVTVTTNGVAFPAERATMLLRRCPRLVFQVSFDGATRSSFEEMRGKNTFDRVVHFVEEICGEGLGRQVGLSMTVTTHNVQEVGALVSFAKRRGVGSVHFPQLVPVGFARENWAALALEYGAQLDVERQLLSWSVAEDSPTHVSANRLERIAAWLLLGEAADCLRTLSLRVTPDGEVLPCPTALVDSWVLGKITDRPQPERLLARLAEEGGALRRFSSEGPNAARVSGTTSMNGQCMRTCESCWLLGSVDRDIAAHGRRVNERHMRDAAGATGRKRTAGSIGSQRHSSHPVDISAGLEKNEW